MPVRKIVFAILAAVFVALLCHRAVAENATALSVVAPNVARPNAPARVAALAEVPMLALKTETPLSPNCDMTVSDVQVLETQILADSSTTNTYFNSVATVYKGWYPQLAPTENQTVEFVSGSFSPVNQSTQILNLVSNELDSAGQVDLTSVDVIGKIINDCFLANSAEQNVQNDLVQIHQDINENQIAIGAFVGQMQSNLSTDYGNWQPWEGQRTFIPQGTFATLRSDANSYVQAAGYIQQNGQLIAKKLDSIGNEVGSLTPK